MPRLDFEKEFAGQLKDRELQPSKESWEKLQGKLEREEKKRSPLYLWLGIAASLTGAVLILNFMFNDPIVNDPNGIVDSEIKENADTPKEKLEAVPQIASEDPEERIDDKDPQEDKVNPGIVDPAFKAETELGIANSHNTSETETSGNGELISDPTVAGALTTGSAVASEEGSVSEGISDAEINALLAQAIAEVSEGTSGDLEVTDAQIEALLADARAEVRKERVMYQTATFDAGELLLEAEIELEHSFREQVFEIIKDGLQKTRNAVVNINE